MEIQKINEIHATIHNSFFENENYENCENFENCENCENCKNMEIITIMKMFEHHQQK